jgi:hypothetical protein
VSITQRQSRIQQTSFPYVVGAFHEVWRPRFQLRKVGQLVSNGCQYSHDLADFWAVKEADLGSACHASSTYRACRSGGNCWFPRAHTNATGNPIVCLDEQLATLGSPVVSLRPPLARWR